jgi:hypothetical protein
MKKVMMFLMLGIFISFGAYANNGLAKVVKKLEVKNTRENGEMKLTFKTFELCYSSHPIYTSCCPMNDANPHPQIISSYVVTVSNCATGSPIAIGQAFTGAECPPGSFIP